MRTTILIVLVMLLIPVLGICTDYYVDPKNGTVYNSGKAPDEAWDSIAYAMSQADGTEVDPAIINIAPGSYQILNPIRMKSNMTLKGADKENTVFQGLQDFLYNYPIIIIEDLENVSIESLTISKGGGQREGVLNNGGGIYVADSKGVKIKDCIISENNASGIGGGIYFCTSEGSSETIYPEIDGCLIENNTSGGFGGGIGCMNDVSLSIRNSVIKGNTTEYRGGGLYCKQVYMENCEVLNNTQNFNLEYYDGGGGIYLEAPFNMKAEDSKINDNTADGFGGGIFGIGSFNSAYGECELSIVKSEMQGNATWRSGGSIYLMVGEGTYKIISSRIMENYSKEGGGAFYFMHDHSSSFLLLNTLIARNDCDKGPAIAVNGIDTQFINCTLVDNASKKLLGFFHDITARNSILWNNGSYDNILGDGDITYCNVEGGYEGEGNTNADPLFASGPRGDYYLSRIDAGQEADSPCIDAGGSIEPGIFFGVNRTDGVFPSYINWEYDIGYYYPHHIELGKFSISKEELLFFEGDTLELKVSFSTAPKPVEADIYLILQHDWNQWSAPEWMPGANPALASITFPANTKLEDETIFEITLPSEIPPISEPGSYIFWFGAMKPGTDDQISGLSTDNFYYEMYW